jgi:hypothetical protein
MRGDEPTVGLMFRKERMDPQHTRQEKARRMADANLNRQDLVEKLEALVAQYNAGSIDAETFRGAEGFRR